MNTRPKALSPKLAHLTRDEVEELASQSLGRALATLNVEAAVALYKSELSQLESERVWRARLADPNPTVDLLFITVGKQADAPINAGLRWDAAHLVLLRSDETLTQAQEVATGLSREHGTVSIISIGKGNEPALLYKALRDEWMKRKQPKATVVDLTGGFKTMSTAAGAAGFLMPGARVAYLDTDQRRVHGENLWFRSEVRVLLNPYEVFGDIERATARRLLEAGRYGPAALAWDELSRRTGDRADEWRHGLAEALDRADRMDLTAAADRFEALADQVTRDALQGALAPDPLASPESRGWMRARAEGLRAVAGLPGKKNPTQNPTALQATGFLDFVQMLITLAQRRQADGEHDLAALFAYRAFEGVVQRRLADRGYDVSNFDWERALCEEAGGEEDERNRRLRLLFKISASAKLPELYPAVDRGVGLGILAHLLKDPLVPSHQLERWNGIAEARNKSVLVHGLQRIDSDLSKKLIEDASALFEHLLKLGNVAPPERAALALRHSQPPAY